MDMSGIAAGKLIEYVGVKKNGKTRNGVTDQFVDLPIGGTLGSAHRESSLEQFNG